MRERLMIWILRLALIVPMTIGIACCAKDNIAQPQPPTPENPDTPEPIIPVPDSSKEPFDPSKPYKPVNKILQVFKYGYPKKISYSQYAPSVDEYITDENNNLVRVLRNGRPAAEFEYGEFFDKLGNRYQVKYSQHYWYEIDGNDRHDIIDYLCKLNENEMIEDKFEPNMETGYHYEYYNDHLVKASYYYIEDGQRIEDGVTGEYEWDSNTLLSYTWWIDEVPFPTHFLYPNNNLLVENRSSLFCLIYPGAYGGIDENLYMAALLGQPSKYIPSVYYEMGFHNKCYVTNLKLDVRGLPEIADFKIVHSDSTQSIEKMKYIWRNIIW